MFSSGLLTMHDRPKITNIRLTFNSRLFTEHIQCIKDLRSHESYSENISSAKKTYGYIRVIGETCPEHKRPTLT